jgi:hypothetical protein
MATRAKYSKKMFENLDRAEVRKLAIIGMKLAPAKAYTMDFKTLVSWVHERAIEVPSSEVNGDRDRDPRPFVEADLDSIDSEYFRDGVMHYITQLQDFVRGKATGAPTWPATSDPATLEESSEIDVEETPIEKEIPKKSKIASAPKKPTGKKRGRPRKVDVAAAAAEAATEAVAEAAPKKPIAAAPKQAKQKIKKVTLAAKPQVTKPVGTTPSQSGDLGELLGAVNTLNERMIEIANTMSNISDYTNGLAAGIKDGFETISAQVSAVREEQTASNNLLGNSMLFLLNSVVFGNGEEKEDLSGVPEPTTYLDIEE